MHKSSMHDANLKFMQPALENEFKNFEFSMIIDFYTPFFKREVHKSFIYNA